MAKGKAKRKEWYWFGALIGAVGAVLLVPAQGPIRQAETAYLDVVQRAGRTATALDGADDPIRIVGYDQEATQVHGRSAPRREIAKLLDRLFADGAAAVVVDFQISDPDPVGRSVAEAMAAAAKVSPGAAGARFDEIRRAYDQDAILLAAVRDRNVVGTIYSHGYPQPGTEPAFEGLPEPSLVYNEHCESFRQPAGVNLDLPTFREAIPYYGNARQEPDNDQQIRRYPLAIRMGEGLYPSHAAVGAALYRQVVEEEAAELSVGCDGDIVRWASLGARYLPVEPDGTMLVNFTGSYRQSFPNYVSFKEVVAGDALPESLRGRFSKKLVFFGPVSEYDDKYSTLFDPAFPGVGIHAVVAHSLITGRWLRRPDLADSLWEPLACLLVGLATTWAFRRSSGSWPLAGAFVLPVVGHYGSVVFSRYGLLVDALAPGLTGTVAILGCGALRYLSERQRAQRERAQRLAAEAEFRRFLSPSVAEIALSDPSLLMPARREISILFSDIRGFTTTAERMTPEELVALLDEYLTAMTQIVFEEQGTLDKYIGDAVMALFGAPLAQKEHAAHACRAALRMMESLARLQEGWRARNLPVLEIGIGVNTAPVSVGRMGSKAKNEYTAIGDGVNFASRLEGLTKTYRASIIVGDKTRELAQDEFLFRELGYAQVKGKTQAAMIFELVGRRADDVAIPWFEAYQKATTAFRARDWDKAEELFRRVIDLRGGDPASDAFLERTAALRSMKRSSAAGENEFTIKIKHTEK